MGSIYFRVNSNDMFKKGKMLNISAFAKVCHCSVHTLRFYDEKNILKPKYINASGYRFYDTEQASDFEKIKDLQEIGFSIKEIKILNDKEIIETIDKKIKSFETKIDKAKKIEA